MKTGRCRKMDRLIGPYADGELSLRRTESVEAHLKVCADCRQALDRLRKTQAMVRQGIEAAATAGAADLDALRGRILETVRAPVRTGPARDDWRRAPAHWSWGTRILVPSVAVMALLAVFIFTIYKPPAPVIKTELKNDCIIDSIDGGTSTVMFFKTHGSEITVIWISGNGDSDREAADVWQNYPV